MKTHTDRRMFLKQVALLGAAAATPCWLGDPSAQAAIRLPQRVGGPRLKPALNAYSFSKLLNSRAKGGDGVTLTQLVDFCAVNGFEGLDATGYFFPGYPRVPPDEFVNDFKRRAFDMGIGISGTGVRNQFTTADKAVRQESVEHVKQWVAVAARLGAPVLRVFADTQMKSQTWQTVAPGCTRDEVEAWIADCVRECAEHGKKFGVIIGVQNHGDFLKTSADHLSLIRRVDSEWCGPIVDTGYYKTDDPYADMAAVAPYAVNWQVKQSPVSAGSDVRTDLKRLLTLVRLANYRGYLPIETLSAPGVEYNPFDVAPKFLAELRQAVADTESVQPAAEASGPTTTSAAAPSAPAATPPTDTTPGVGPTDPKSAPAAPADARPRRKPPNKNKNNPPPVN